MGLLKSMGMAVVRYDSCFSSVAVDHSILMERLSTLKLPLGLLGRVTSLAWFWVRGNGEATGCLGSVGFFTPFLFMYLSRISSLSLFVVTSARAAIHPWNPESISLAMPISVSKEVDEGGICPQNLWV